VLLAGAGLMFRTYERLRSVDPGFRPQGVLTLELTLPAARYGTHREVTAFWERLSTRVETLPGVSAAGLSSRLPLSGEEGCRGFFVEDRPAEASGESLCVPGYPTTPGYLAALGVQVSGAAPGWSDVSRGAAGVVVTRALAERLWPGQDPVGKGIRGMTWERPFYRVTGVAADVRANGLDQPPVEAVYYPTLPMEGAPLWSPERSMTLAVRSASGRPEALVPSIRQLLAELDPEVPVANAVALETVVARSMARTSFTLLLLEIAAAVALLLGAVGLYGVLSYVVGQRRGEIAIRMALGARMEQVAALVVRHSLALALAGVALGLLGAFALTRLMQSLLYEVSPTDPVVMGGAALLLVLVALVASSLPVRRATRVEPMSALRGD
jgi:putative ABC transport system permease protein